MIKAVIIEDELNSRELLQSILENQYDHIKVVGVAEGLESGVSTIKETNPDVVFLDIEIQGGTGFDLLRAFDQPGFKVIFVTGYDHYAIKAIKYSALDYILKPINLEELGKAIAKINTNPSGQKESLNFLNQNVSILPEEIDQFVLSDDTGHRVVKFEDVLFVKADRTYVTFFLKDTIKHIVTNPLNFYESILPASIFYRIHKSYLVNIKKVLNVHSGRGGLVELAEGFELPIAYRRKTAFLKSLRQED